MLPSALLLAVIVAAWPQVMAADEPPTVHEVASGLISQCGSGMILAEHDCSVARSMKASIQSQLDAGKTKNEILDNFVSIYGEQVLAAPRKSGFGLTAWVIPFLAVGVGAAVVSVIIWGWVRRRSAPVGAEVPSRPPDVLGPYERRVDEDLSSWSGEHR
jgi:cytochrome c-type biogenesis protein CcmH/NrfF